MENKNKVMEPLAIALMELEVFEKLHCNAPGEDECQNTVVAIIITITTEEHTLAVGAYCIHHIALLAVYASAAEEEDPNDEDNPDASNRDAQGE